MHREILGSISVRKNNLLAKNIRYLLFFTHDRILAVDADSMIPGYIDSENNTVNRSDILSADEDNFEIDYMQVREIRMKKGGFSLGGFGRIGKIVIDTFDGTHAFDMETGQDYRRCVKLVKSFLEEKLVNQSPLESVKYCPECGSEFQMWVTVCPDCGSELVDEMPEDEIEDVTDDMDSEAVYTESPMEFPGIEDLPQDTMVSTARAPNEMVANMWKEILSENGIPCLITKPGLSGHPPYTTGLGDHEIMVMVSKAKKAWQILEPFTDV